ncbi:MAG: single-stranded-DNA-specific exonuclease RecJ [Gammaproteobacteria bacterium]|nr:single-stranded-DNA-specific exonuclease RecJ [Gammaproteobacteria bacterium]
MLQGTRRIVRRAGPVSTPAGSDDLFGAEIDPVLARVYRARGLRDRSELALGLAQLHDFRAMAGIDGAVQLLLRALEDDWPVLIVGDFDADGATASAVAVRGLAALGFARVDYLVPNRFEYGYGLSPEIVAVAAQREPRLIVTVDNGVSSLDGVRCAREAGIEVLITDHHLPGEVLPPASAIVNPNQAGCGFPSKSLAGVGVMFYVLMALRARMRALGHFGSGSPPNLASLLDLVALGTVADVVPLDHNNRILVEQGLRRIRAGLACPGVNALLSVAGRDPRRTVAADLAFAAGPRLNAAGRMDDMSVGIACLLEDAPENARQMAADLDALNRDRRATELSMTAQASAQVERWLRSGEELPYGVCIFEPGWHQGVVGIVASRIKDRLHRPVIAFADAEDGGLKGSARSISGLHLRDTLEAVDCRHPGLITRFGGHAAAAGLSLPRAHFERFAEAFDAEVRKRLDEAALSGVIHSDGELEPERLGLELAQILRTAGPWGQSFPEPLFDGVFEVLQARRVGERHIKLRLRADGGAQPLDAIRFNVGELELPSPGTQLRVAYTLDVNEYQGTTSAQLRVEHWEC